MGYTIQVGAFGNMGNAVRLTLLLRERGIEAYHFVADSGLYKVRFGNFATRQAARIRAEYLLGAGVIEDFYVVSPDESAAARYQTAGVDLLREEIIRTARRFIGVPYSWGGESLQTGFDCSGLTMVVYQLNGLDLPRTSRQQWQAGRSIKRSQLSKGDLVFFATSGGKRVSHVGIYTGNGRFLHAPRKGRRIQYASLADRYYRSRYVGARSYL
jgi:cell wall-associated NlpC family hydrolase